MKNWKQTVIKIADALSCTPIIALFTVLVCVFVGMGIATWGHYEVETHEEPIVYEEYQPGAEIGSCVSFTAVSAEVGGYTEVEKSSYLGTGASRTKLVNTTYYGYIILTDSAGNSVIAQKSCQESSSSANRSGAHGEVQKMRRELNAWVNLVNLTENQEYKGVVVENQTQSQSISFTGYAAGTTLIPSDITETSRKDHQNLGTMPEIEFYDWANEPTTQTVEDSRTYVMDHGIWYAGIGILLLAFMLTAIAIHTIHQQNQRWEADRLARQRLLQGLSDQPMDPKPKPAAPSPSQQKVTTPPKPEPPKPEPDIVPSRQSVLEEEKQDAMLRKQKAEHMEAERRRKLTSIVPQADQLDLCTALLLSDPQQIKQNIRQADAETLEILIKELQRTTTDDDAQMQEIAAVVQHYAADTLKKRPDCPPSNKA